MLCCTLQGPAVWALRAQTDKLEYAAEMRRVLEATPNLYIREAMVTGRWSVAAGSTGASSKSIARCDSYTMSFPGLVEKLAVHPFDAYQ